MSPMSVNSFDAQTLQTLQAMARRDAADPLVSPQGERIERRVAQLATGLIGLTLVLVLVV